MELFGYMERFICFINGVPEYKAHPILLNQENISLCIHKYVDDASPHAYHGHWFIFTQRKMVRSIPYCILSMYHQALRSQLMLMPMQVANGFFIAICFISYDDRHVASFSILNTD